MKRSIYTILMLAGTIISLFISGCGSEEEGRNVETACVIGVHSNSRRIPVSNSTVEDGLYQASYTKGTATMINCDGDPSVFCRVEIPDLPVKGLSKNKKKEIASEYTQQLMSLVKQAEANAPEVNTLKAITLASQALRQSKKESEKVLIIMDTGLSTVEPLDFSKGILNADIGSIVDELERQKCIPDLKDVSVCWLYLAQTADPQKELSEEQKLKLQNIWSAVLEKAGAKSIEFRADFASPEGYTELLPVSEVEPERAYMDIERLKPEEVPEPGGVMETVILDSSKVCFIGDQTAFTDENAAMDALEQLAVIINAHPENSLYVVGTTATGREDACRKLSIDRAEVVKSRLIALGVDENRLTSVGLGYSDYWHIPDTDEMGNLIEEYAMQNRKVLIIDAVSEDAQCIFSNS